MSAAAGPPHSFSNPPGKPKTGSGPSAAEPRADFIHDVVLALSAKFDDVRTSALDRLVKEVRVGMLSAKARVALDRVAKQEQRVGKTRKEIFGEIAGPAMRLALDSLFEPATYRDPAGKWKKDDAGRKKTFVPLAEWGPINGPPVALSEQQWSDYCARFGLGAPGTAAPPQRKPVEVGDWQQTAREMLHMRLVNLIEAELLAREGGYVGTEADEPDLIFVAEPLELLAADETGSPVENQILEWDLRRHLLAELSPRERDVFLLLEEGYKVIEIAAHLGIKRATVDVIRHRIKEKAAQLAA